MGCDPKGVYIFTLPVWENDCAADKRREDHEDRQGVRLDERGDRVATRVEGRTDRTRARCADGKCGVDGAIDSISGALGGILGGAVSSSGLTTVVAVVGVTAVVGVGYLVFRKR